MKEFKYLKTFESFGVSGEELNEEFLDKLKSAMFGTLPKIEVLVKELPDKAKKYPEGYEKAKAKLKSLLSKNSDVKTIKSASSDQSFPFTEDNYLAIAGFYNFGVNYLDPVKLKTGYCLQIKPVAGASSVTGHRR